MPSASATAPGAPDSPRFGVNYTPRIGWFHAWHDLDLDAIGEDLRAISDLGLDHVRIFPLWPLLQPNRTLIRPRALEDVRAVVDVAGTVGLDVVVDVVQGHLSSFDFVPAWLSSCTVATCSTTPRWWGPSPIWCVPSARNWPMPPTCWASASATRSTSSPPATIPIRTT